MRRNAESYQLADNTEHQADLPDWKKQKAAEQFLENLENQAQLENRDHSLAHELSQAAHDPEHKPSWLTGRSSVIEHHYDSFRKAMEPLDTQERDYVVEKTASIILGNIPDQAASYAHQPASHILQGEDPPEFRASFETQGYNSMMEYIQKDLEHRVAATQETLHRGLSKSDRYDYISAVTDLQSIHNTLQAMETGETTNNYNFYDRRNQKDYVHAKESRAENILQEYQDSLVIDFPELGSVDMHPQGGGMST